MSTVSMRTTFIALTLTLLCGACDTRVPVGGDAGQPPAGDARADDLGGSTDGAPGAPDDECPLFHCQALGVCAYNPKTFTCEATAEGCAKSHYCVMDGRCTLTTAKDGVRRCAATTDAECAQSATCHTLGSCVLAPGGGGCTRDPRWKGVLRCAESITCRMNGQCLGTHPHCTTNDEHCARSFFCRQEGSCTADHHKRKCIVASDAHCQASSDCKDYGRCAYRKGSPLCVVTAAGCRASWACRAEGRCAAPDSVTPLTSQECLVGSSADCEASFACRDHGKCTKVEVPSDPTAPRCDG